jgi:hypothetical protein
MKATRFYFTILFLMMFLAVKADVTNGTINVYFKPGKAIAFKLYNNVKMDCGAPNGQWQSVVVYVSSKKAYFDGKAKVKKGDPIIDTMGRQIGYVVSDQVDAMPMRDAQNKYTMRLAGYIIKDNVQPASVPENRLAQLINANKKDLSLKVFKKFIDDFGLTKRKDDLDKYYPDDVNYVTWYDTYAGGPTVFRIQLIFDHGKLIAIFHGSAMPNTGFPETRTNTNNLLWLKNNDQAAMKKMANSFHKLYEVPDKD